MANCTFMQALRSPGYPHGPSPWCHQRGRTWAGTCGCSQERLLCTPRRVPLNFSWIFPDTCPYMGRPTCPQPGLPLPRSAQHAPASGHPQAIPRWVAPLPSGLCSHFLAQALPHPQPRTAQEPGSSPTVPRAMPAFCAPDSYGHE